MTEFDWNTATPADRLLEVERRNRNRAAGRSATDDGHGLPKVGHPTTVPRRARIVNVTESPDVRVMARFSIPWSCLAPDNKRFAPALRKGRAVLVMTPEYRRAKRKAAKALCDQNPNPPIAGRVHVSAMLFEPDSRTRRDLANYAKLAHDALTDGGVIMDDSLIDWVRWTRAGVDIDAPRLELVVEAVV